MKVIDINGKEREVKYTKKIHHNVVDATSAVTVEEVFVEVLILGHNNTWLEWWPFDEFKRFNPDKKPRWKLESEV